MTIEVIARYQCKRCLRMAQLRVPTDDTDPVPCTCGGMMHLVPGQHTSAGVLLHEHPVPREQRRAARRKAEKEHRHKLHKARQGAYVQRVANSAPEPTPTDTVEKG